MKKSSNFAIFKIHPKENRMSRKQWFWFVAIPTIVFGIFQLVLFAYLLALPITLSGISENVAIDGFIVSLIFMFYSVPLGTDLDATRFFTVTSVLGLAINLVQVCLWFNVPLSNTQAGLLTIVVMIASITNIGGTINFVIQNKKQIKKGDTI